MFFVKSEKGRVVGKSHFLTDLLGSFSSVERKYCGIKSFLDYVLLNCDAEILLEKMAESRYGNVKFFRKSFKIYCFCVM